MGREASITQEQVDAVAERLRTAGEKATARAVRAEIGAGSMATVLKYLQAWQARQARPSDIPATLPPQLQRTLMEFVAQEVAAARAELDSELAGLRQANADLIVESEQQTAAIDGLADELATVQLEKSEVSGRLQQAVADVEALRSDAHQRQLELDRLNSENARLQTRLELMSRVEAEAERLRAALEAERSARVAAEQAAAVAAARVEAAEVRIKDLLARRHP